MQIKNCVLIEPFICNESNTIVEVAKKLRETTLRHIFVVNDTSYPSGIISVLDINNRVVAEGKNPEQLTARDIMSKPVDVISLEDDVAKVTEEMINKSRVMNPVVNEENKIVGIITLQQLLKNKNES